LKRRDLVKRLEAQGYRMIRDNDNHSVFHKPGKRIEAVPHGREINENTAKDILRRIERP